MLNRHQVHAIAAALCAAAILFFPQTGRGQSNTIRVMTFNIHHAEGLDGIVNIQRIASVITNEKADLVGLQEVDRGTTRVGGRDLPAQLAQLTGMTCVFSNNLSYQGGQYGNAILSRFPVRSREHRLLQRVGDSEQRGWIKVSVDVHGRDLSFWNTHIDHRADDSERVLAVNDFAQWLTNETGPVIFCGDFNDHPGSNVHNLLKNDWLDGWEKVGVGNGYTVPVLTPRSRIDYIWVSKGSPVQLLNAWVPYTESSDHLPVVMELKLTNAIASPHVFHFSFDEGRGSQVEDSIAGLGGTFVAPLAGLSWNTNSPSHRANDFSLSFDGSNRIVAPDPNELIRLNPANRDYSLEAWVRCASDFIPSTRMILFQYEGDPGFSFSLTTNRALHTTTFRKSDLTSTATLPNDGTWHHVAAIHHDGDRFDFYIDGILKSTVPYVDGPGSRSNPTITIGSAANQVNPFVGDIDRIRFSNRALAPGQFDFPASPGPLPPEINWVTGSNGVSLSWPSMFAGFYLQSANSVSNINWTTVPHVVQGNENRAEISFDQNTRFFRLKKNEN